MKNTYPPVQKVRLFLFAAAAAVFIPACQTGELKDQVLVLSEKQTLLERQRDSLTQLVVQKSIALEKQTSGLNAVAAEKSALESKNKSLQSGLYSKGEQLKKAASVNEELVKAAAKKDVKADSLQKEIMTLQQRIAVTDAMIFEAQKTNSELAQMMKEKEERRIADSIAEASKPKPVPPPKESGFISITEAGGGFGLGDTSPDYSRSLISITSVAGYRINSHFIAGIGAGAHIYNGGAMIPLYIDMRYTFKDSKFSPYIVADGGMLFNISDLASSGVFINSGIGLLRKLNEKVILNLSVGGIIQGAPAGMRNTFVNIKGGVSFRGR